MHLSQRIRVERGEWIEERGTGGSKRAELGLPENSGHIARQKPIVE
jgi:hypothetical protein